MLNASSHWKSVALNLANDYTVIAPDLIGHGDSAAPRGDYSLGAHAASIRDLLAAIGIDRATFVGHSLGGGVAMQFFYQFPQRVERLALISSGGLGHEVSPMLRTAALPGMSALLSLTVHPRLLVALRATGDRLRQRGAGAGRHLAGNNLFAYYYDPEGNVVEYTTEVEQITSDDYVAPVRPMISVLWGSMPPGRLAPPIPPPCGRLVQSWCIRDHRRE